jgi:hypothetical protein
MPLYSLEFTRTRYYRIEVEADSLGAARARAESTPTTEILGGHDFDAEIQLDEVYAINEDGERIDEPEPAPESTRLGGDEIMHNLIAGDGAHLPVEACQ